MNILSTAINQHTPKKNACCFQRLFLLDTLHLQNLAGAHAFFKNLEGISKTKVSEEWHTRIS
jgi:hypothetical protein